MILLKNLRLLNFLSHEETEIPFGINQKLLIDGNSGGGKSSILEAIIWSLYGQGRTSNAALVRRGTDKAEVHLTLDTPQGEVTVTRSITAKGKHTLEVVIDGVAHPLTGVRELQAWIESDLTGASYLLFVNSIAYLQGGGETFVTQNASRRKDLLLEIVKTVDFEEYYERTKKRISHFETELAVTESTVAREEEWINEASLKLLERPDVVSALDHENETLVKLQKEESGVKESISAQEEIAASVKRTREQFEKNQGLKENIEGHLETARNGITLQTANIKQTRDRELVEAEVADLETSRASIEQDILAAVTHNTERATLLQSKPMVIDRSLRIKELEEHNESLAADNTCPAKDDCPHFARNRELIAANNEKIASHRQAAVEETEALQKWQEQYDNFQEVDISGLSEKKAAVDSQLAVLRTELQEIITSENAKTKVAELGEQVAIREAELQATLADLATMKADLDALELKVDMTALEVANEKLRLLGIDIVATKARVETLNRTLGVLDAYQAELPKRQETIANLRKTESEQRQSIHRLGLLKDAFGSKGLKSLVIDYIIPELEEKINNILSQMSEFQVVLDTQQTKADGEGNKEGLFITIINDMGEEMPFESYSGGQKLQITVAITEALATLQKCGFRLFDETWEALDQGSLENFTRVMNTLLERFPQVICISHLQEIKSQFEEVVTVVRHNGVSKTI